MKSTYIQNSVTLDFSRQLPPDDESLPRPLGWVGKKRPESAAERSKLLETMRLGGLVPERYRSQRPESFETKPAFQCPKCLDIFADQYAASRCCGARFNRILVCVRCNQRFVHCTCKPTPQKSFPSPIPVEREIKTQAPPVSAGNL
jgi:hypothetical protein